MEREEALDILGIKENAIGDDLIRARYQRLIGRYPPDNFPDMAIKVRLAYQLLTQSRADEYIRYLKDDVVNITDLEKAIPPIPASSKGDLEDILKNIIEVWCHKNAREYLQSSMKELMGEFKRLLQSDFDPFDFD